MRKNTHISVKSLWTSHPIQRTVYIWFCQWQYLIYIKGTSNNVIHISKKKNTQQEKGKIINEGYFMSVEN